MSRTKKIFVSATTLLLAAIIAAGILCRLDNHLYYYFYKGPRVVISLHIKVDDKDTFAEINKDTTKNVKAEHKENYSVLSVGALTYGPYAVVLTVDDIPFILQGYLYNCWDVQHINLYAEIDTENKTVSYCQTYTYISEEDDYTEKAVSLPRSECAYTDDITIYIGT